MKLIAKTKKGKERIATHGDEWDIVFIRDCVQFSDIKGNWALVRSKKTGDERWINLVTDHNFETVKV